MSTEKPSQNERIDATEKLYNESEVLPGTIKGDENSETMNYQNPDNADNVIETNDSTDKVSINLAENSSPDTSEKVTRPKLASHRRVHHHHHHHHHRDDLGEESENETATSEMVETSTVTKSAVSESIAVNSDIEEVPKKRIPLAAHHRSHRHHRSGEHHHRSSSRRHRSRNVSKVQYYPATGNDFHGHVETMEIDKEEFARLHTESLIETVSKKADTIEQETVPNTEYSLSHGYSENVSDMENLHGQDDGNSTSRLGNTILAAREANPRATRKASSVKSTGTRSRQKEANVRIILTRILIGIAALLIGCIVVLLIMRARGQSSMTPNGDDVEIVMPDEGIPGGTEIEDDGKTVIYKGQKYRWNKNLTTFLILGTDRTVAQQQSGETAAGINGQADTILLAVIDNTNRKISFINVNRDTFVPVAEYTSDGEYAGDKKMQLCLSYAYGKDNETSCRYTADAVSKYLFGMPVDYYVGLSYDAIQVLNDSVGGVTLTVAEDLSAVDPSLERGATVTLAGSQATLYCQWRNMSLVETNENRMSRQKQYLYAFMSRTIDCTRSDLLLPLELYANAKPYMTTNVTPSQLTYITSKVLEYGVPGDSIHSIPGKSVVGSENHVEFYPDQTALYEQVLDTFYNKVA